MAGEITSSHLNGLVLAGGRSSRMGKDKSLIQYHDKPQGSYLFDLLGKFCDAVYTSCRKEQIVPEYLNPIHDKFYFESPLNGILSAFERKPENAWLAVAVDMPFVNEEVLQFLISNRDQRKIATCFYDSEGKLPEPLLTLWEPQAFPLLKEFTQEGKISPREFLLTNDCNKIMYSDPRIHVNINTPEDMEKLRIQ